MDDPLLPISLQEALIPSLPPSGYYIPNFITEIEEAHLLQKVSSLTFCLSITLDQRMLTLPDRQCSLTDMEEPLPSSSSSSSIDPLAHQHTSRYASSHLALRASNTTPAVYAFGTQ